MDVFSPILKTTLQLFLKTNSISVKKYPTFMHNQGIFDDPWYNYIIPLVACANLDKEAVRNVIKKQNQKGKNVGYYINKKLVSNYQSYLKKQGYHNFGNDTYLVRKITKKAEYSLNSNYKVTTDYDLEEVIKVLEKCFPDWPEERRYSKLYENYKKHWQPSRFFETFCIFYKEQIVAAASIVVDQNLNISYLHNDGVLLAHRRKGLHTALIQARHNYAVSRKVSQLVTIVEQNSASYLSYQKLGYDDIDSYFIFAKG